MQGLPVIRFRIKEYIAKHIWQKTGRKVFKEITNIMIIGGKYEM